MKPICSDCGWEIINPQWWNIAKTYEGQYLCDDCELDQAIKKHPSNQQIKTGANNG
jgi:hypothetical protein